MDFVVANPGGGFSLNPNRPPLRPGSGIMMPPEQYFERRARRHKIAEKARERWERERERVIAEGEGPLPPRAVPVELVAPSSDAYEESPRTDVRTFLANLGVI